MIQEVWGLPRGTWRKMWQLGASAVRLLSGRPCQLRQGLDGSGQLLARRARRTLGGKKAPAGEGASGHGRWR